MAADAIAIPDVRAKSTYICRPWFAQPLYLLQKIWQPSCERWCRPVNLVAGFAILALLTALLSAGCARRPSVLASAEQKSGEAGDERKLPFEQPPGRGGISPTSSLVPAETDIPEGTPLTIRLKSSISNATSHPGDSFQAVLDEPIVLQGTRVVPAGTFMTGEVVASNRSASLHSPAYLRLKLASMALDGKTVPIESSSIFAKAGLPPARPDTRLRTEHAATAPVFSAGQWVVEFGIDRPLTFRLTAPVSLPR